MKRTALLTILAFFSFCYLSGQEKVGIGVINPSEQLEVAGKVFSNEGGFKFPDSTVQTTAAYNTNTSDAATPRLLGYVTAAGIPGPITRTLYFKDGSLPMNLSNLIPVYAHNLEVSSGSTPNFGPLHITSDISMASAGLFESVASGSPFSNTTLFLLEDVEGGQVYSSIKLSNTNITQYSQSQHYLGGLHYAHLNSFAFDFETIEISIYTVAGRISYCWDRGSNSGCP